MLEEIHNSPIQNLEGFLAANRNFLFRYTHGSVYINNYLSIPPEKYAKEADVEKIKPFGFAPGTRTYNGIGKKIGDAFSKGKKSE